MGRWFDVGQEAVGVVAIGQFAVGVVAIGQLATGVVAVGQLARGVVVVGQVAVGVRVLAQLGVAVESLTAMLGIAGRRSRGLLVVGLLPPGRRPRALPLLGFAVIAALWVLVVGLPLVDALTAPGAPFGPRILR